MVIVKIMEGLGNQMFEYACGRRLALHKNTDLKLDLGDYGKPNYPRKYKLNTFDIKEELANPSEVQNFIKYKPRGGKRGLFHNFFRANPVKYFKEKEIFVYDESILNTSNDVYLEGYWQSYKYFEDIEKIIRQELTLKHGLSEAAKTILEKINSVNAISVHIRRGDYKNSELPQRLLSLNYHQTSIKLVAEKISEPHFFIFSDEPDWIKQNLKIPEKAIFIHNPALKDYEELILMSKCKHNIIANSSFSWWAAWLNNNPDKIVVTPKQWFKDPKIKVDDLLPKSWITLNI